MSQTAASISSINNNNKRTRDGTPSADGVDPSPKFSKTVAPQKVVPEVVAVDFSDAPTDTTRTPTAQAQATTTPAAGKERSIATRLNWKLINKRDILNRLMSLNKMNAKNAAYIRVDTKYYYELTGERVNLGEYSHFKVKGPMMKNIFGISSQTVNGNISHSINYDVNDASQDPDVPQFLAFLALVDDVLLHKCVDLAINSPQVRDSVDWVEDCKDEESGSINVKRLRAKVAKYFNGALRCTKKTRALPEFAAITFDANDEANIGDFWFFKTKIRSKSGCAQMLDVSVTTSEDPPRPVFYKNVPCLFEARESYAQPQLELPGVNFAQKEFYTTWHTRKIKYVSVTNMKKQEAEQEMTDDFGDVPVAFKQADIDEIKRQEREQMAMIESGNFGAPVPTSNVEQGEF